VLMFCSPKVSPATEEIISDYFKILESDFTSEQTRFVYVSNDDFRDNIMMETLDCIQEEFDTSELFLRSFKLMTTFTSEAPVEQPSEEVSVPNEPAENEKSGSDGPEQPTEEVESSGRAEATDIAETESIDDEKVRNEILKVQNRVPKWFQHPNQNNSKILITYMNLLENSETVTIEQLGAACSSISRFMGNYAQMINIADKNHGKVFSGTSENITLWEPVKEFIIQQYIDFKKSYYNES